MSGTWWRLFLYRIRQFVMTVLTILVLVAGLMLMPRDTPQRIGRAFTNIWNDLKAHKSQIRDFFTHDDIKKAVGQYDGLADGKRGTI